MRTRTNICGWNGCGNRPSSLSPDGTRCWLPVHHGPEPRSTSGIVGPGASAPTAPPVVSLVDIDDLDDSFDLGDSAGVGSDTDEVGANLEVTINGSRLRVRSYDNAHGTWYHLLGERGGYHHTRPMRERGVELDLLYVLKDGRPLHTATGEIALFVPDAHGGLLEVRAGSAQWRASVNRALVAAGKDPLPEPVTSTAGHRVLEPPTTVGDLDVVTTELGARMAAHVDADPVEFAVPGAGTLSTHVHPPSPHRSETWHAAELAGTLTVGNSTYVVSGSATYPTVRTVTGRKVPWVRAEPVRKAITAAWAADGPHSVLRETAAAEVAAAELHRVVDRPLGMAQGRVSRTRSVRQLAEAGGNTDRAEKATAALLRLAALTHLDGTARAMATSWARGWTGTAEELLATARTAAGE